MKRSSRGYKMVEKAKAPPDKFAMNRNSPIAMKQEHSKVHVNKINQSQNILSIESHIPSSGYIELSPKKIQQFHNTTILSDYKEPGNINNGKTKDTDFQLNNDIQCLPIPPFIIPNMVDQVCEDLPIDVTLTPAAAQEGSKLNRNSNCQQTSSILLTSKDDKISKHLPDDIKLDAGCEELELKNNTQCLPTSPSIIAMMDNQIDENLPDEMIPDIEWEDLENNNYEPSDYSEKDPDYKDDSALTDASTDKDEPLENNPNIQTKRQSRKRIRDPKNWKANKRKRLRNEGQEYVSKRGTTVAAKEMRPPCLHTCKKKCYEKISHEKRLEIFKSFYHTDFNNDMKRTFVANRVTKADIERRRSRNDSRLNKRRVSLKYSFKINNKDVYVCKTFFLNTLCISQSFVDVALKKILDGGCVQSDQRGKKEPPNKTKENVKEIIRQHIQSFPVIESHYSRERSSRKYLGNHLSISKMFELYLERCRESGTPRKLNGKQWLYYHIFNTEFNYAFKLPVNDSCDTCDRYLITLKETTGPEKELLQIDYNTHLLEAQSRYSEKTRDKTESKENSDKKKVIMIDLQKCLPTPNLFNSQMFYLRKLWTLNLTIYDATIHKTFCCMWDESISGRGGEEIASCLNKWALSELADTNVEELTVWSDNCAGQNRNFILVSFYIRLLKKLPIKVINHKYLLKGHTHMEVDVQHSVIERAKKKLDSFQIMVPWDWMQFVRSCNSPNNPMEVISMETNDFKNFKSLYSGPEAPLVIRKKGANSQQVLISEMVWMQVRASEPDILFYKTSFNDIEFQSTDLRRGTRRLPRPWPEDVPPIRSGRKPVNSKKYKDLMTSLQWVPTIFHDYYKKLQHGAEIPEFPEEEV